MSDEKNDALPERVEAACDRAAGDKSAQDADADEAGHSVRAGHKYLNAKGRGDWWYRMVWRNGSWQYFSDEKLPTGTFLAGDRKADVHGDVFIGEIVCQHDKGGPVDAMYLVCAPDEEGKDVLHVVEYRKRKDGQLVVTLPDGREVAVPNPRRA